MNIGLFRKPKVATVLTTLYFTGVLASAYVLYASGTSGSMHAFVISGRITGVTFFIGIVALYFTARMRTERVVYLDRKKTNTTVNTGPATEEQNLIDVSAITTIVESKDDVPQRVLNEICKRVGAGQGAIYTLRDGALSLTHGYAMGIARQSISYQPGEGMVGRVAADGTRLCIDNVPEGYITVYSGLGSSSPTQLALIPIKNGERVTGVLEIAAFTPLNETTLIRLEECAAAMAVTIF